MPQTNHRVKNIMLFIIAAVLVCIGKYYHEPWMDEWRNMSIPLEATSLKELYQLRGYESHPMTYYLMLFGVKIFGSSYIPMFVIHAMAAVSVLFLLIFKSPFSFLTKMLLCCSYYFLYETLVFNRQYVFVILGLFLLINIVQKKQNWLWYLLVAIPFIHLHVYSWLLIVPLTIYYLWQVSPVRLAYKFSILLFIVLNCALAYYSAKPPSDSSNAFVIKEFNIGNVLLYLRYYINGFIAYFNPVHPDNNIYELAPSWAAVLFSALFFFGTKNAINNKKLRQAYLVTFILLTAFNYHYQACAMRHTSFYFFNWLTYLWLDHQLRHESKSYVIAMPFVFYLIMMYQCSLGISSWIKDVKEPYSASKAVAQHINTNFRKDIPVISYYTYAIDAPAACLGRKVFALHCMHPHLYYNQKFSETDCSHCSQGKILEQLSIGRQQLGPCLLLVCKSDFTNWLTDSIKGNPAQFNSKYIQSFDQSINISERYDLMELK